MSGFTHLAMDELLLWRQHASITLELDPHYNIARQQDRIIRPATTRGESQLASVVSMTFAITHEGLFY
jgi:hypothetical protein